VLTAKINFGHANAAVMPDMHSCYHADGDVVDNLALSASSTCSRARVCTLVLDTGWHSEDSRAAVRRASEVTTSWSEGVSTQSLRVLADGEVVPYGALCIESAGPDARVDTVLSGAGSGPSTLIVDDTLGGAPV